MHTNKPKTQLYSTQAALSIVTEDFSLSIHMQQALSENVVLHNVRVIIRLNLAKFGGDTWLARQTPVAVMLLGAFVAKESRCSKHLFPIILLIKDDSEDFFPSSHSYSPTRWQRKGMPLHSLCLII